MMHDGPLMRNLKVCIVMSGICKSRPTNALSAGRMSAKVGDGRVMVDNISPNNLQIRNSSHKKRNCGSSVPDKRRACQWQHPGEIDVRCNIPCSHHHRLVDEMYKTSMNSDVLNSDTNHPYGLESAKDFHNQRRMLHLERGPAVLIASLRAKSGGTISRDDRDYIEG
ncbi:hypothetical protein FIBSPDRAFT_166189 [Athelia psychrophila]|uniref:Uncharacterized protein n=1 Tax=Athelia psychrophila TaxID=1759441 RepID=A0A166B0I2_9AGAM|nr:hypothetical protein FIBSPDRAFT_166189 [Fibularhizoctonia sp. CBS 109695]